MPAPLLFQYAFRICFLAAVLAVAAREIIVARS
jgi:hypothetical protein